MANERLMFGKLPQVFPYFVVCVLPGKKDKQFDSINFIWFYWKKLMSILSKCLFFSIKLFNIILWSYVHHNNILFCCWYCSKFCHYLLWNIGIIIHTPTPMTIIMHFFRFIVLMVMVYDFRPFIKNTLFYYMGFPSYRYT